MTGGRSPSFATMLFWASCVLLALFTCMQIIVFSEKLPPRHSALCPEPICPKCNE